MVQGDKRATPPPPPPQENDSHKFNTDLAFQNTLLRSSNTIHIVKCHLRSHILTNHVIDILLYLKWSLFFTITFYIMSIYQGISILVCYSVPLHMSHVETTHLA